MCIVAAKKCRQIRLSIDRCSIQGMAIAPGTLYLVLKRLKEEALVETYLVESGEGPARKYYHLTQEGKNRQQQLVQEWQEFVAAVGRLIEAE